MAISEEAEDLTYNCFDDIFQCKACKSIRVHRTKYIGQRYGSKEPYRLEIEIKQECPDCGSLDFRPLEGKTPWCPNCEDKIMICVAMAT